jgi:hypothetical protein
MTKRIGITVLAMALLGGLVLASSGFGESSRGVAASATPNASALASARAHVGVFRRAIQPSTDAIAPAIVQGPLLDDGVVDTASARAVRRIGREVWLANSSDGRSVCEVTEGAMACPPVEEIAQKGLSLALAMRAGEPVHVSGIAADGVVSVDVVLASGAVRTVPVSSNFFSIDLPAIPQEARWQGPNGPETYTFPAPNQIG